jgi:soluble lytic murein transglycosylase-like protein
MGTWLKIILLSALTLSSMTSNGRGYDSSFSREDTAINIDNIMQAIMEVESNKRFWVTGRSGEKGICQISKAVWRETTKRLGVKWSWHKDPFIPEKNLIVARAHFEYLLKRCNNNWQNAVKCYNAGYRGAMKLNRGWKYLRKVKWQIQKQQKNVGEKEEQERPR